MVQMLQANEAGEFKEACDIAYELLDGPYLPLGDQALCSLLLAKCVQRDYIRYAGFAEAIFKRLQKKGDGQYAAALNCLVRDAEATFRDAKRARDDVSRASGGRVWLPGTIMTCQQIRVMQTRIWRDMQTELLELKKTRAEN